MTGSRETYFAPAERTSGDELSFQLRMLAEHDLLSALLRTVGGVMAVLNEQRQIVALNNDFLEQFGIDDPAKHLGLRLGESLECVYAEEAPAGCGTTKYCPSCGAAVAMVASLEENRIVEKICALRARRSGRQFDMSLSVRSRPISVEGRKFILLLLRDITLQEQRAALERIYFHDINNTLNALRGAGEMLLADEPSDLAGLVGKAISRLTTEMAVQQQLAGTGVFSYSPAWRRVPAVPVLADLKEEFSRHPAAEGKKIIIEGDRDESWIFTDRSLLLRVLGNMIINALEATEEGGEIRIGLEQRGDRVVFRVWNAGEIPAETVPRIFQKHFSTKEETGRGLGTYSMKLLGEKILKGQIDFTTSSERGTVFEFSCPARG